MVLKCKMLMQYVSGKDQDNYGCNCTHPYQCHFRDAKPEDDTVLEEG